MKQTPNILSASRIVLCLPLLLVDATTVPFWVLYVIAGTTDMLDGFLARRWSVESKFGARLDSLADFVFVLAVGYKLSCIALFAAIQEGHFIRSKSRNRLR